METGSPQSDFMLTRVPQTSLLTSCSIHSTVLRRKSLDVPCCFVIYPENHCNSGNAPWSSLGTTDFLSDTACSVPHRPYPWSQQCPQLCQFQGSSLPAHPGCGWYVLHHRFFHLYLKPRKYDPMQDNNHGSRPAPGSYAKSWVRPPHWYK